MRKLIKCLEREEKEEEEEEDTSEDLHISQGRGKEEGQKQRQFTCITLILSPAAYE